MIGKRYRHKQSGVHEVIALATDAAETAEPRELVVYKNQDGFVFVRPVAEFLRRFAEVEAKP